MYSIPNKYSLKVCPEFDGCSLKENLHLEILSQKKKLIERKENLFH